MAHAQKPNLVFVRNGRVHLNRRGRQFIRLLAAEVCASAVVMLDTPCSEVVWRVLAVHSIRQFPLNFPSRPSPCAITFQLGSKPLLANMNCAWLYSHLIVICNTVLNLLEFTYLKKFYVFSFFKVVFNAWGWSTRPKHVVSTEETKKFCCGWL